MIVCDFHLLFECMTLALCSRVLLASSTSASHTSLPLRPAPMHAFLYLCLPCLPSSGLRCVACLPVACAALRASLWLALPCVLPPGLRCVACLLAKPECFLPLTHSRTSSSLASLALLPSVSYSLSGWNGPEWGHSGRVG